MIINLFFTEFIYNNLFKWLDFYMYLKFRTH